MRINNTEIVISFIFMLCLFDLPASLVKIISNFIENLSFSIISAHDEPFLEIISS